MSWSEERIAQLKTLWAQGYSAAKIARTFRDVSRSAVLCKVHRLKLPSRETLVTAQGIRRYKRRDNTAKQHRRKRPAYFGQPRSDWQPTDEPAGLASLAADIWQAKPGQTVVPLVDLEDDMCRWPQGDPKTDGFGFCGARQAPGSSFCDCHSRLAFQPGSRRRK